MRRVFFIDNVSGVRRVEAADFPLAIGGAGADISLPGLPAGTVVAHIALADGHAYLQPADADVELFHNHEFIDTSAWLKSGDRVQLGDWLLKWDIKGDQVFIKVGDSRDELELQPPAEPPPDPEEDETTRVIPVNSNPMPAVKRRRLRYLLLALFSLLALIAVFVIFATPVAININPEPDDQSVSGFPPAVSFGSRMLVVPGTYTVEAELAGYQPLRQSFEVSSGGFRAFDFELEELPGRLQIMVDPSVPVRVSVADAELPVERDNIISLQRGTYELLIETDRYLAESRELEIAGFGELQALQLALQPAWAEVFVTSEPETARVNIDGEPVGQTPLVTEIIQGQREIELSLAGFKSRRMLASFVAGTPVELDRIILEPNDGTLALETRPQGATVSIGGNFHGTTPVAVTLASGTPHELILNKPGYGVARRTISLEPDERKELQVDLTPEYGIVFASSKPADASLTVDGKRSGSGTQRLRLTTRPHELVFSKPGYVPQTVTVTPRTATSQNVDVALNTVVQVKEEARPAVLKTAGGQEMRLLEPSGTFQMGASRREAGRRANESQRLVELTRPYYLSSREVSNAEFRRFDSKHRSGTAEGVSLDGDRQPVVNVSWDDAARYCNWLSEQDKLNPAYGEKDGRMEALPSATNGYRLPTEAEWVYAARVSGRSGAARYPWGEGYPPKAVTGNFADAQIADTLANVVKGYNDGYRSSAPVGSFSAQPEGFHDLGGNVAEWTNDFYAVYPGQSERLVTDPAGPAVGDHHVVRGSSWRDGSITELRLSYRDYSRVPRDNLGFRIARYADK
ncbi:MAG: SUMF1/EgtB/PvdO family nonheme iron enzyme [Xanthomonadales bacterium]|nr:SUMF1/EgtB/PvdO family nonheme iron enzyme [Gammaproteobacteria bacterium]NNK04273.1 SUMF1/EgtB/PvdO family nonheme iron enzyme [Xanthomonadales bacterium]